MTRARLLLPFLVLLARESPAQQRIATCVRVEALETERAAFAKLVSSEIDRHPSHQARTEGCRTHLKVELFELAGERYVTGRIDGEVPQRVRVDGPSAKALVKAVEELLRVVLGNDPVVLRTPGGRSWFADKVLSLRDTGRSTFDVSLFESATWLGDHGSFTPGLRLGYSREIADWQIGVEVGYAQNVRGHERTLELDTEIRLHAATAYYFSAEADASGFAGVSLGVAHQRFSGPRSVAGGGGAGTFHATGPIVGLRAGVEFFRTTTMRAQLFGEASVPIFGASDPEGDVIHSYTPGLALGAGVRF